MVEQETWKKYYMQNPGKLRKSLWERSKTDPNWAWPNPFTGKTYLDEEEEIENQEDADGLGTGLKPSSGNKNAPQGSKDLECFLKQVEEELILESMDEKGRKRNNTRMNEKFRQIHTLINDLKNHDQVAVPTDKTNSF